MYWVLTLCQLPCQASNYFIVSIILPSCQLKIGTCHLPLQGLHHEQLQLLTFNTRWKEFRVEIRKEALCPLGKTGRTGLQIIRYFQEKILWTQFLYLLISSKALKSFMVMPAPRWVEVIVYKKYVLDWMYFPSPVTYILTSPLLLQSSFSELSKMLSPGL